MLASLSAPAYPAANTMDLFQGYDDQSDDFGMPFDIDWSLLEGAFEDFQDPR